VPRTRRFQDQVTRGVHRLRFESNGAALASFPPRQRALNSVDRTVSNAAIRFCKSCWSPIPPRCSRLGGLANTSLRAHSPIMLTKAVEVSPTRQSRPAASTRVYTPPASVWRLEIPLVDPAVRSCPVHLHDEPICHDLRQGICFEMSRASRHCVSPGPLETTAHGTWS
jgi:hypothetical protein